MRPSNQNHSTESYKCSILGWVTVSQDPRSWLHPQVPGRPPFVRGLPSQYDYSGAATQDLSLYPRAGPGCRFQISPRAPHQARVSAPLGSPRTPQPACTLRRPGSPSRVCTTAPIRARGGGKGVRPSSQWLHRFQASPMRVQGGGGIRLHNYAPGPGGCRRKSGGASRKQGSSHY